MATSSTVSTELYYTANSILEFGNPESHQQVAWDSPTLETDYGTVVPELNGDTYIRQGTIIHTDPADPSTAFGVCMWNYNTTGGRPEGIAVVHRGDVNLYRMANGAGITPQDYDPEALRVLHERQAINFHPHALYLQLVAGTVTPASAPISGASAQVETGTTKKTTKAKETD